MDPSELDSGLFGISLSDAEDSVPEASNPKMPGTARTGQTEENFRIVKHNYMVKVENGEIWKTTKSPLGEKATKQEAQALLHAVEELYFFKMYHEGAAFVMTVLGGDHEGALDRDVRNLLEYYQVKCSQRAAQSH
ncbi:hypothetical protein BJ170DRAFT_195017 [Xylariales sp. AK1849]|nr:hypothetical protein BJ170DRAFT_195017 [Xylariales sp. AK1849]